MDLAPVGAKLRPGDKAVLIQVTDDNTSPVGREIVAVGPGRNVRLVEHEDTIVADEDDLIHAIPIDVTGGATAIAVVTVEPLLQLRWDRALSATPYDHAWC
ncbi:MAG: hypothetical protein DCC55_14815 [Chloroflexi bacterium]|nr:MAG: hypothetical protein DCC55_14815 [Chloroflexota bacterium]